MKISFAPTREGYSPNRKLELEQKSARKTQNAIKDLNKNNIISQDKLIDTLNYSFNGPNLKIS